MMHSGVFQMCVESFSDSPGVFFSHRYFVTVTLAGEVNNYTSFFRQQYVFTALNLTPFTH